MLSDTINPILTLADRGLCYGDGLFETILIKQQRLINAPRHWQRLQTGCERLAIEFSNWQDLQQRAQTIAATCDSGVLKIILTRGVAGRGYQPANPHTPNRFLSLHTLPNYPDDYAKQGIHLGLCSFPLARQPLLAGIKHLNRLEQVLASQTVDFSRYPEALLQDQLANIIGGTRSNLFFLRQGKWHTPSVEQAGIAGTVRAAILAMMDCDVGEYSLRDLQQAEQAFVCNSIIGCWPITRFNDTRYPIGPATRELQQLLQQEAIIA